MRSTDWYRGALVWVLLTSILAAQVPINPPGMAPRPLPPQMPVQAQPNQQQQQTQPPNAAAQATPQTTPQAAISGQPTVYGGITFNNASLTEVIDMLARQLHINYVLDPRVKGGVILNTYGETKNIDTRSLLEAILRINAAGLVQQGELYRIVPLNEISRQPIHPQSLINPKDIPEDDRTMLNLVFLKYATADDLAKLLDPFRGENSTMYSYPPANLLLILDSHRNMRRTMELIALFDNDTLANQRVRLFETKHGRPSDLVKELEAIVKSISLNEKSSPIKFLPVDRINTIIAVAPNPGAFGEVEKWLTKLDIPIKATTGSTENHVYRVKYGNAMMLAMGITMLYGGNPMMGMGMMGMPGMGMMGMGGMYGGSMFGGMGGGMGGMYGGGMGGMYGGGMGGMYGGGMGGMYGGGMGGMYGGGMGGMYPGGGYAQGYGAPPMYSPVPNAGGVPTGTTGAQTTGTNDLSGSYLGNGQYGGPLSSRIPRIIPNPFNNSLMIQATPQDYDQILKLLKDMDLPPRQVLIDARIYEVDLGNSFSSSVAANLQQKGTSTDPDAHHFLASLAGSATNLSDGFLVGRTKELLATVQLLEGQTKAKIISAPSVIATDSIPATINVGLEVPTLTAQAVTGAQQSGTSLFANTIANRDTGVTLAITAQVNQSGIVTLVINQEVSAPQAPQAGQIQSPSFSKRQVQTQVTVQDGDTIAVGGIITEQNGFSTTGIPYLNHIPVIGAVFGTRSYTKSRVELIIFMTPRVIYDTNQIQEATDELKNKVRHMEKLIRDR